MAESHTKEKQLKGKAGYYLIENSFKSVNAVKKKMDSEKLGLAWATRVKAGYRRDKIVARQKGFNVK